jgi:hypothetical protein
MRICSECPVLAKDKYCDPNCVDYYKTCTKQRVGTFPFGDCVSRVQIINPNNPVIGMVRRANND